MELLERSIVLQDVVGLGSSMLIGRLCGDSRRGGLFSELVTSHDPLELKGRVTQDRDQFMEAWSESVL